MIGALRAAVMLGGSSIVAILATLATAKGVAVMLGPKGTGELALVQSAVELSVFLAGLGVSVSLVRHLASALELADTGRATAVRVAALTLAWTLGSLTALVLLALRASLAETIFGSAGFSPVVVAASVAVPFTLAAAATIAILSTHRFVGSIAVLRTMAAIVAAIGTLAAVAALGNMGVAVGITVSSVVLWSVATVVLRRRTTTDRRPRWSSVAEAAQDLVRSGVPFAASTLVGTGVQLAMPFVVAARLDTEAAGFYRAATQISAGYLTFMGAAMLQDYYPRLSGHQDRPAEIVALIDQQLKLVMILTIPLLFAGMAVSDLIVPILYSAAFAPAVAILAWQLTGMVLRLPSWTLSFAILARGRNWVYFAVELVGGAVLLVSSVVGIETLGLAGLGLAVLITYAAYYPVVWLAVRHDLPIRITGAQRVLAAVTLLAVAVQALTAVGLAGWQRPLAAGLALASTGVAVIYIGRSFRLRGQRVPSSGTGRGSPIEAGLADRPDGDTPP